MAAGAISCNTIYDDQSDCPRGLSLRFVYDYNMEYVNSFHKKVHCVNVYVFDENGKYVDNWMETGDVLKDENWRMQKEIGEGKYTLLAYGVPTTPSSRGSPESPSLRSARTTTWRKPSISRKTRTTSASPSSR